MEVIDFGNYFVSGKIGFLFTNVKDNILDRHVKRHIGGYKFDQ